MAQNYIVVTLRNPMANSRKLVTQNAQKIMINIRNFSITRGIVPSIRRPSGGRDTLQVHPCKLGAGIHASDSLGQLPPDVRLTMCLPRVIEQLQIFLLTALYIRRSYSNNQLSEFSSDVVVLVKVLILSSETVTIHAAQRPLKRLRYRAYNKFYRISNTDFRG